VTGTVNDIPPLDEIEELNGLVRQKAAEVERAAKHLRRIELIFVVVVGVGMLASSALGAWNTYRLSDLARALEDTQVIVQEFNEGHADSTYESHESILGMNICVGRAFAKLDTGGFSATDVEACFRPATPPPPDPELPSDKEGR
jgi:hypothetical protein